VVEARPAVPRAAIRPRLRRLDGWSLVAALLVAALLRALPLLDNRFHPDEALYASFARLIASGRDPLLSGVVVDKPPLPFYLNGLSVLLFGGTEFAVRLPAFYTGVVSAALLFALARRLYDGPTAQLAAWLLALSPFAILFSITLFIDPLLTAFLLWGTWLTLAGRRRGSALAFALAFATKQTALIFVPLALALVAASLPSTTTPKEALRRLAAASLPITVGLALAALALFAWDAARRAPVGFWEQGYADNAPGRFVRASEVLPRARAWLDLLHHFTASRPLNLLFVLGLPTLLARGLPRSSPWLILGRLRGLLRPSPSALADLILAGYLALYLAAYWLLAFNVWDRYLLPILPLFAILLARVIRLMAHGLSFVAYGIFRRFGFWSLGFGIFSSRLLPFAFCLLLLPSAFTAARSGYPIGGDHGAYDGMDDVARFIRTLPEGGVLYDHWLGWQWGFYLFDAPLHVSWFPTPDALAADLTAFGHTSPRYLVVPAWEADAELRAAAARAGFEFVPLHAAFRRDGSTSFIVYQLAPTEEG
jgi:4-amino-4-deoxy-L-arabinose transferase-like glycosyltransferase